MPCKLLKKYTLPKQNKQDKTTFSISPRRECPSLVNFSSTRNKSAGASPAKSKKNRPSATASGLPASATSGSRSTLGNGGNTTNHLAW